MVLLPTALQLDVLAAGICWGSGGLRISAVQVEDPVTFADGAARALEVAGRAAGDGRSRDLVLRSGNGATHLRATVGPLDHGGDIPSSDGSVGQVHLPGAADLVYPPMFHGPAFQVIGRFGRQGAALVSQPPTELVRWDVHEHAGGLPTHLLELILQTCGVWELAETGRMMRPYRIDEVVVRRQSTPTARVRVRARAGRGPGDRVFDGVALDESGHELVRVRGYRPVDLGGPTDGATTRRIRAALAPSERPTQSPSDEGVTR
ncbi:hypothetical protein acdb102_23910 [Acidothermaceae bacterium B102]|nr:hypothetical protein acdb102_23910 [Acidothermaceae bacterium B102]